MLTKLLIDHIKCPACAKLIQLHLEDIEGVMSVKVRTSGRAEIESTRPIGLDEINDMIKGEGHIAKIMEK